MKIALGTFLVCASVVFGSLWVRAWRDGPRQVDAGGPRLRLQSRGHGPPTVVLETELSDKLQAELARFGRVVTYDRAGWGCSEPSQRPRDAANLALELRTALRNARLDPPFILVAEGIDTLYARVFASKFAAEMGGLVLIEPDLEEPTPGMTRDWLRARCPDKLQKMDGVIKACLTRGELKHWVLFQWENFLWHHQKAMLEATAEVAQTWETNSPQELHVEMNSDTIYEVTIPIGGSRFAELRAHNTTLEQVRAAPLPPELPVFVISASGCAPQDTPPLKRWEEAKMKIKLARHKEWLGTMARGKHLLAPDCVDIPGTLMPGRVVPPGPLLQAVGELSRATVTGIKQR